MPTQTYQPLVKATSSEKTDESTVTTSTPPPKMKHEIEKEKKEEKALKDNRVPDYRKASTGTLNRLILVAQALENEVDSRRQSDVSGSKIVFSIRMANMILLILVNVLLFSGVGQYYDKNQGGQWGLAKRFGGLGTNYGIKGWAVKRLTRLPSTPGASLMLTADKWMYTAGEDALPDTFREMRLNAQFFAASITVSMLLATVLLQVLHVWNNGSSRLISMAYAFGAVPFSLFVFGLEMHYSACPWLDDYLQSGTTAPDEIRPLTDVQCGINGWALAGIFELLSCGLFMSEGLITAFFKSESSHRDKKEAIL